MLVLQACNTFRPQRLLLRRVLPPLAPKVGRCHRPLQVHAALKAAATAAGGSGPATAAAELAALEGVAKWVRAELAQAERKLPGGGSSLLAPRPCYTSWSAVGHVLVLMVQGTWGAGGDSTLSPLASDALALKVLSNAQVVAHAKEVLQGVDGAQRQALCTMLFGAVSRDLKVCGRDAPAAAGAPVSYTICTIPAR